MNDEIQELISQATDAVNQADFSKALELARAGLLRDPQNADLKLIEAISLSQLQNSSAASDAFREAIDLAPNDAKTRYNAAVHEFNLGNVDLARSLVDQALQLDPNHTGAKTLLERMPAPATATNFAAPPVAGETANYPREAYGSMNPTEESLPFIRQLGPKWTMIGVLLTIGGVILTVISIVMIAPVMSEFMAAMSSGDQAKIQKMSEAMSNPILSILGYTVQIGTLLWVLLDLIHRRGNMVWLIAHIPCSCCGLGWITLPLYMGLGRKPKD